MPFVAIRSGLQRETPDAPCSRAPATAATFQASIATKRVLLLESIVATRELLVVTSIVAVDRVGTLHV